MSILHMAIFVYMATQHNDKTRSYVTKPDNQQISNTSYIHWCIFNGFGGEEKFSI